MLLHKIVKKEGLEDYLMDSEFSRITWNIKDNR
jgi:hypothetical protein